MDGIKKHISKGKTGKAIDLMLMKFKEEGENDLLNQTLIISSRFSVYEKQKMLGLGENTEELNKINYALLKIVEEYESRKVKVKASKKLKRPFFLPKKKSQDSEVIYPTIENPMLIGFLVDVSASMTTSIKNSSGRTQSRLESFQKSFDDLLDKAKDACYDEKGKKLIPLFKLFVYGFGFGNLISSLLFGNKPKVRSLLKSDSSSEVISIDYLINNWEENEKFLKGLVSEMFGETPMYEAIELSKKRIIQEKKLNSYINPVVLFIISDGDPTDARPDEIVKLTDSLKKEGVLVISTFITNENVVEFKKLYKKPEPNWSSAAKLMFDCASNLPLNSPFYKYLREFEWDFEEGSKIFAQVNEAETLKEFLNLVLSPIADKTKE